MLLTRPLLLPLPLLLLMMMIHGSSSTGKEYGGYADGCTGIQESG